jgi:8-oxo-dGTP diphosphatase
LTNEGVLQAELLVEEFGELAFTELYSSPYSRCIETLEPLAERCGLEIKIDDRLSEATTYSAIDSFMLSLNPHGIIAACSHGNVVPAIVEKLVGRQVEYLPEPILSSKGSVWDIEVAQGSATSVRFFEPLSRRAHAYL